MAPEINLLTYACLFAENIGQRPKNATVFYPWPNSPFLSWCIPSPSFHFPCLFARCFVAYLFASSLGVPCDSLTGDGFWRFPIHLHFLFFITFSMGSCLVIFQSVVLDTLSVHFRCKILRGYLLMKVCILFSVFCVLRHVSDPYSKTALTFELNILKLRSTTISCSCSLPQA